MSSRSQFDLVWDLDASWDLGPFKGTEYTKLTKRDMREDWFTASTAVRAQFPQFNGTQWQMYHCLSFKKAMEVIPSCGTYCETYSIGATGYDGIARDGCHEDDFPCHCARSQVISDLIEPCIFPFKNASSTCTQQDLSFIQNFVTESCGFYNITQYAAYVDCPANIAKGIEDDIARGVAPVPTIEAQKFRSDASEQHDDSKDAGPKKHGNGPKHAGESKYTDESKHVTESN